MYEYHVQNVPKRISTWTGGSMDSFMIDIHLPLRPTLVTVLWTHGDPE